MNRPEALELIRSTVPNFRDVGGMRAGRGRVRTGVVYRAAQLTRLEDSVQEGLVSLGVRQVYDLRTIEEIEHRPDSLPTAIDLTIVDVLADRPHTGAAEVAALVNEYEDRASVAAINAVVSDGRAERHMHDTYRHLITLPSARSGYRTLFTGLARGSGAAVIHCTAGKDRTGWAIAVLQLLAGASLEDVVEDYLASNDPMRVTYGPMLEGFAAEGGDADALAHMMLVYPEYLETALSLVETRYGDIPSYLEGGLGMAPADIDSLHRRMVSPASQSGRTSP